MKVIKLTIPPGACKACVDNVLAAFQDYQGVLEVDYLAEEAIFAVLNQGVDGQAVIAGVDQKLDGSAPDFNLDDCRVVDLTSTDPQLEAATKYSASLLGSGDGDGLLD